ncbi:GmrSD restriction endonuclease domain-containing protein [Actinospongicola halichondriae]|uniref:GmrSD restriction endonuclease domain-containing protein n=1 Tax=Actinospongicola halichondriae TaxID=3236844 RepID=UPI003D4AFB4C
MLNEMNRSIGLEQGGLAELLGGRRLTVPSFQRSYAWRVDEVNALWDDLRSALVLDDPEYFLGTIVLAQSGDERSVIDGQQRLATASLLLAAVRNAFLDHEDKDRASVIESEYLIARDLRTAEVLPRLRLNATDDPHFRRIIFERDSTITVESPASHRRLSEAMEALEEHVDREVRRAGRNWAEQLLSIVSALESSVRLIIVQVASDADAYLIFETLNDRGLPLNIADLLKNYLFGISQARSDEVQEAWAEMDTVIQSAADEEAIKTFIRHSWMSSHGAVRERDLYRHIKRRVKSPAAASEVAAALAASAPNYTALLDPLSKRWVEKGVGHDLPYTLNRLGLEQYRPLALAALDVLDGPVLTDVLEHLVSWLTRGLIVGGIGGGTLERYYAEVAVALRVGKARDVDEIRSILDTVVPSDDEFHSAMRNRRMNKLRLSQYLVQACELSLMGVKKPGIVTMEQDAVHSAVNVLPRKAVPDEWPAFDAETVGSWAHRLGNVLILPDELAQNLPIGWPAKREALQEVHRPLAEAACALSEWTPDAISSMQDILADAAPSTWPR